MIGNSIRRLLLLCGIATAAVGQQSAPVRETEPLVNSLLLFGLLAVAAAMAALAVRMVRRSH
jgi:hypothetical protein